MKLNIAVLAGDGIGPEIIDQALKVTTAVCEKFGHELNYEHGITGACAIDEVGEPDEDGDIGATGRSQADAPEIDGAVYLRNVAATLKAGDIVTVNVEDADAHDLFGVIE